MVIIYRPRKPSVKGFILAMTPLFLSWVVVALLATRDILRIIESLAVFFVPFVAFIVIGFEFTYAEFGNHKLTIVKFFAIRNNIDFKKIQSLKYRAFGTVNLDGINIYYVNNFGFRRKAILGSIGAYGQKQIAAIVDRIIEENPEIHVDQRVLSLTKSS
jgi:hypothetical protein